MTRLLVDTVEKIFPRVVYKFRQYIYINELPPRYKNKSPATFVMKDRPAGFFSIFFQVMGAVDFCRLNHHNLVLDFGAGPYVESSRDKNWWNYYFNVDSFIFNNDMPGQMHQIESVYDQHCFAEYGKNLPNKIAKSIISESGIVPNDHIGRIVSSFVDSRFLNNHIVGIHYRGTDKSSEAVRVPYEYVSNMLSKYRDSYFFVATDEVQFLEFMHERHVGRVLQYDSLRSYNSTPVHLCSSDFDKSKIGEDALVDCLILSRCHILLRTESNLSRASSFFNPQLKVVDITKEYIASC